MINTKFPAQGAHAEVVVTSRPNYEQLATPFLEQAKPVPFRKLKNNDQTPRFQLLCTRMHHSSKLECA